MFANLTPSGAMTCKYELFTTATVADPSNSYYLKTFSYSGTITTTPTGAAGATATDTSFVTTPRITGEDAPIPVKHSAFGSLGPK